MSKELEKISQDIHELNKQIFIIDRKYSKELLEIKKILLTITETLDETLQQLQDFNDILDSNSKNSDEWNPYKDYEPEEYETYEEEDDDNWSDI